MRYEPEIGDELRDRYGRPGEIVDIIIEGDKTEYAVEWIIRLSKVTHYHFYGEVKKARRRYLKNQ